MPDTPEQQHTEWKESWREEYLKWVCGFANAQGGRLYVGKDDNGQVVGIPNSRRLLEDLPNQIRDLLGIQIEVNHHTDAGHEYLELVVEAYPYPVSYRGKYYRRSGSTNQELRGTALDAFLLQKQGKRWDGVPMPSVAAAELDAAAFDLFRERAARSGRVDADVLQDSNEALLENLHLTDGPYLKRAALLLFHPQPEQFVTGAYVKIGYFATDDDLRYQDEVHGPLLLQVDRILALLQTRYLQAEVRYEGSARVEQRPFPEDALREALLNALAHKDYSGGVPVQISVYDDYLLFWNEGQLPEHWTIENLQRKHPSKPFNPDVANTLFRAGYIESWGRGTIKMIAECRTHQLPEPHFLYDAAGFAVRFFTDAASYFRSRGLREDFLPLMLHVQAQRSISNRTVQQLMGVSKPTATRYLTELERNGFLQKMGRTGVGTEYVLKGS